MSTVPAAGPFEAIWEYVNTLQKEKWDRLSSPCFRASYYRPAQLYLTVDGKIHVQYYRGIFELKVKEEK